MNEENQKQILSEAAKTLIDAPLGEIVINVREAKDMSTKERLMFVLMGKQPVKKYVLERTTLRNCYRIASRAVLIDEELFSKPIEVALMECGAAYYPDIVYIIACGIQNNGKEPSQELIDFVWDNFQNEQMFQAFDKIMSQYNVKDFMQSIILIKGADILTRQKDQKKAEDQVSPADQAETIAPGTHGV